MYVCLCNAITDSQIKAAVDLGDRSLTDLKKRLGVAVQCGKCAKMASEIVQKKLNTHDNFYEVA